MMANKNNEPQFKKLDKDEVTENIHIIAEIAANELSNLQRSYPGLRNGIKGTNPDSIRLFEHYHRVAFTYMEAINILMGVEGFHDKISDQNAEVMSKINGTRRKRSWDL